MTTVTETPLDDHQQDGLCLCPSCMPSASQIHHPESSPASAPLPAPAPLVAPPAPPAPPAAIEVELTTEQRALQRAALAAVRVGLTVTTMRVNDEPVTRPQDALLDRLSTETSVREAWNADADARPGLVVGPGWAVLRLTDRTQPDYEARFGPVPMEALHWRGEGSRYWLVANPLPSDVTNELDGYSPDVSVASPIFTAAWSGREPWLVVGVGYGSPVVRLPAAGDAADPDGYEWVNPHLTQSARLDRTIVKYLGHLAAEAELERLEGWAVRRDEDYDPADRELAHLSIATAGDGRPSLLSLDELADIERGPELVEGLGMEPGSLAILYGPSGAGKSFAALDLSYRVAAGLGEWHGRPLLAGAVVYVAAEGPETLPGRLLATEQHHGRAIGAAFQTYTPGDGFDLTTREALDMVTRDLLHDFARPRLIVVDTLSASTAGRDQSSTPTMTALSANARELAQRFDACVLVIHHTGKDVRRGARGSTAITDAADTVLALSPLAGGRVRMKVEKRRDAPGGEVLTFRLVDVALPSGSSCVLVADDERPPAGTGTAQQPAHPSLVVETLTALGGEAPSKSALWQAMRERSGGSLGKEPALSLISAAVDAGEAVLVLEGRRMGVRLVT